MHQVKDFGLDSGRDASFKRTDLRMDRGLPDFRFRYVVKVPFQL